MDRLVCLTLAAGKSAKAQAGGAGRGLLWGMPMTIQSDQSHPRGLFQNRGQLLLTAAAAIVLLFFALVQVWNAH